MRNRLACVLLGMMVAMAGATPSLAEDTAITPCKKTSFGSKTGGLYLEAETLLFVDEDTQAALEKLTILRKRRLNCYELKFVVQLAAAAYMRDEQYLKAAQALEEAIHTGALIGEGLLRAYYQVAQIYLQEDDLEKARDYLLRWLEAGAEPNSDQYMQLAVLHNKLGDNWAAAGFLESLLAINPAPKKPVIDFVIFIYNETKQKVKLANFLRQTVIPLYPYVKRYWEVTAGLYFEAHDERNAFETLKAAYLSGLLTSEEEIMRVVNFYNQFDTPFAAASILSNEIEQGHVEKSSERLETLASLWQISREYQAAIPVLQDLAAITDSGQAYERLGRSYFELGQYENAAGALELALERQGLKNDGQAWSLTGRAWYHMDQRDKARAAFAKAGDFEDTQATASAWLSFMDNEDFTFHARRIYTVRVAHDELSNIKKGCDRLRLLGQTAGPIPPECDSANEKLADTATQLAKLIETLPERPGTQAE